MEIDGSVSSKGVTIFGTLLCPPSHSTTKFSKVVAEHNSAAANNDSVPALPSTSPIPAGLEPEVAGVVQTSAFSVQPEGEQVGNPTVIPDQANPQLVSQPKRSRGRPKKDDQTRHQSTSTSTSGSKRTRSINNDWPDWLPQDWQIITKTRNSGTGAGYDYKTYVCPDGSRCRSKPEVLKKLNQ